MRIFLSTLFLSLLFSKNIEALPFDWGGQFGYVNNHGAILWNTDWRSNRLLFDGTWAIYPTMFGSEIEEGFNLDHSFQIKDLDTTGIKSNFKYDQGDYLLDRFDFTLSYGLKNRQAKIHGFKRTYAGSINQYSNGTLQPQQQSYIFEYQSIKDKDHSGYSLGHFNTFSGFPDSLKGSLVDNRITSSNFFWNRGGNKVNTKLEIDYFLQRYKTSHSLAEELDPRYLSRNKYKLELNTRFNKYEGYLTFIKNIRSIKSEAFYFNEWDKISFKFGQALMNATAGVTYINEEYYFERALTIGKNFSSANINFYYNLEHKPIHPYYSIFHPNLKDDITELESISGSFILNFKENLFSTKISRFEDKTQIIDEIVQDSMNFRPDYYKVDFMFRTNMIPFLITEINYDIQGQEGLYSPAAGEMLGLKLNSSFKLFDQNMTIDLNGELKHYRKRKTKSNFNFIEMVPILNNDIKIQQPINIFNASITARVSKLSVSYEWYNITQLIFGSIGSDQNNYFELQPDMPVLGRQINLNISWAFQD